MTLAEMSMRNWIMQPGTMITHPASVRYGAISVLGVAAILATVMSTLYTSAASALGKSIIRGKDHFTDAKQFNHS